MIRGWQESLVLAGERQDLTVFIVDLNRLEASGLRLEPAVERVTEAPAVERMAWISGFYLNFPPVFEVGDEVLILARGPEPRCFAGRWDIEHAWPAEGEVLLSADAVERRIIETLINDGDLVADRGRLRASEAERQMYGVHCRDVVARLMAEQRLYHCARKELEVTRACRPVSLAKNGLVPLASMGLLSQHAAATGADLAVNSGFVIWWPEEYANVHSSMFDPVGLVVQQGHVTHAPLYRRPALLFSRHRFAVPEDRARFSLGSVVPSVEDVSMESYWVEVPHGPIAMGSRAASTMADTDVARFALPSRRTCFELNPPMPEERRVSIFTASLREPVGGPTARVTPPGEGLDLVVVGQHVVGIGFGGRTEIPLNGYVLRMPVQSTSEQRAFLDALTRDGLPTVRQGIVASANGMEVVDGFQAGPRLVRDGKGLANDMLAEMEREEFVHRDVERGERGTPPVNFYEDFFFGEQVENRRSRMAAGVLADKRLVLACIHGTERRTHIPGTDSKDATAREIIEVMQQLGCVQAVHLDGGGSGSLWYGGGLVNKPADRHDLPLRGQERYLHSALCFRLSGGNG